MYVRCVSKCVPCASPRRAASTLRPRAGREYRPAGPLAPAAPAAPPARQHRAGVARAVTSTHNETLLTNYTKQ